MTVAELIARLQRYPSDFEVFHCYDGCGLQIVSSVDVVDLCSPERGTFDAIEIS